MKLKHRLVNQFTHPEKVSEKEQVVSRVMRSFGNNAQIQAIPLFLAVLLCPDEVLRTLNRIGIAGVVFVALRLLQVFLNYSLFRPNGPKCLYIFGFITSFLIFVLA